MDEFNSLKTDLNALALLFQEPLYMPAEAVAVSAPIDGKAKTWHAEGSNKAGVVFVYRSAHALDGVEKQLFNDIVSKGIKLGADDFTLVRMEEDSLITLTELQTLGEVKKLILWGVPLADIGIKIPSTPYQISHYNECSLLPADTLDKIGADTGLKKQLWAALRLLFNPG